MATTKKTETKSSVEASKYTSTPKINLKERLDAIKYKAPAAKPTKSVKKQRQSLKGPSGLQTLKTLQTLK